MKIKKLIAVALICCLSLALCACGGVKNNMEGNDTVKYYNLVTGLEDMTFELSKDINKDAVKNTEIFNKILEGNFSLTELIEEGAYEHYDTSRYLLYIAKGVYIGVLPASYTSSISCIKNKDEFIIALDQIFAQSQNFPALRSSFDTGEYFGRASSVLEGTKIIVDGKFHLDKNKAFPGFLCLFEKPSGELYMMIVAGKEDLLSKNEALHMVQSLRFVKDEEKNLPNSGPFNENKQETY